MVHTITVEPFIPPNRFLVSCVCGQLKGMPVNEEEIGRLIRIHWTLVTEKRPE